MHHCEDIGVVEIDVVSLITLISGKEDMIDDTLDMDGDEVPISPMVEAPLLADIGWENKEKYCVKQALNHTSIGSIWLDKGGFVCGNWISSTISTMNWSSPLQLRFDLSI